MPESTTFQIADPDGTFLTLNEHEAERMLAYLETSAEFEPLGENLESLRAQLSEWVNANE